jgi:pilus assembly protein CpaF
MKFLSFQSNAEIVRVCKNLSEHGCTGHITSSEGGLKTHLADGSRATIFRPNNGSQWAFFVRKFGSASTCDLKELITDKGNQYPIGIIKWGIHGCLNLIFSGDQNSGKTTNTRAAVREIDRRQPIRTLEADFELYLNDAYYDKNILGTRPSERIDFPKIIELLKSSEAHTILFGETASLEHAKHLIDLLLAGTKRIITTGHWPTTDELVSYFVHSMGAYGGAGAEDVEAMVARLLHLDIHCVKENDGHRHIDRITEIIPYSRMEKEVGVAEGIEGKLDLIAHHLKLLTRKKTYYTRDIVMYENGEYHMINPISSELSEIILRNLPPEERPLFLAFNQIQKGGANQTL